MQNHVAVRREYYGKMGCQIAVVDVGLEIHAISTDTPYLGRHCQRNTSSSLPRGMPTVVDESVEVCVRDLDGDTECKRQRLRQVQAVNLT